MSAVSVPDGLITKQLGPILLAVTMQAFLFGICVVQAYDYFTFYHSDQLGFRLTIWALMLFNLISCVCDLVSGWFTFVVNFGDIDTGLLYAGSKSGGTSGLFRAFATLTAQSFFCYRAVRVSKSIAVGSVLGSLVTTVFISNLLTVVWLLEGYADNPTSSHFVVVGKSTKIFIWATAVCDVAISAVFIYQLSYKTKASRGFSVNTDSVIDSLLRFSFGTASLTSAIAILTVLLFTLQPPPTNFALFWIGLLTMPRLYTISVLFTLNARQRLPKGGVGLEMSSVPYNPASRINVCINTVIDCDGLKLAPEMEITEEQV